MDYEQIETSWIKLNFVLENVNDKPKLQMAKRIFSSPYGSEMAASQMRIKMRSSQQITVQKMQK